MPSAHLKKWPKNFKNAIDKIKWRLPKVLFSTRQLFWSEFCQTSKAIRFFQSEKTVSAFYIFRPWVGTYLKRELQFAFLFLFSASMQGSYFTWILPISKIDDIFFKNPEFFPLCEIVASLYALFLPLHICAGVLYMGPFI